MQTYNGHRSWNAWNVSLWVNNDEWTYSRAVELVKQYGVNRAAWRLLKELPAKTPDGAQYNHMALRLAIGDIAA
jgi:hypothetical protein